LGFKVALTADTDNRRVHGYPIADFAQGLTVVRFESREKQMAVARFAVSATIVESRKLAFGGDSKGCGFFSGVHSVALIVPQFPELVIFLHYEPRHRVQPTVLVFVPGCLIVSAVDVFRLYPHFRKSAVVAFFWISVSWASVRNDVLRT
jgi:hypothetical protein